MGLAAAKNKRKLGNDPNNTKWSRDTGTFGQKILRAQGWQPGQYLGAKDAPHAEWHTEASSAHIRVVLKDDMLGLGAKRNNGDECTGLDAFQHLLGRLNGKSDEALETERKAREDLKLSLYVERKLGTIRFVRGGWLVGDQLQETPSEDSAKSENGAAADSPQDSTDPVPRKSKKRKTEQDADKDDEQVRKKEKKSKKRKADSDEEAREKKEKKRAKKRQAASEDDAGEVSTSSKRRKSKKDQEEDAEEPVQSGSAVSSETDGVEAPVEVPETRSKKERKKDKKEKDKKEKRKKEKRGDTTRTSEPASTDETSPSAPIPADSSASTPSGSGTSTPTLAGSSRYLARSRFIAQKRMAFADTAALNQIFMIKS